MAKTLIERQRKYWEAQREKGFKRVVMWVPQEQVNDLKLIAKTPHAIAKAKQQIITEITKKLEASEQIKMEVKRKVFAKTRRAFLAQARAHLDRQVRKDNAPPARITFETRPPQLAAIMLKEAFFYYDPVSQCWFRPTNPKNWNKAWQVLSELNERNIPFISLKLDPHHHLEDIFHNTQKRVVGN